MKPVPLSNLEGKIIRPGFEEKLKPLLRYKGNQTLGRVHRLWNLLVSAMEHDATASDITQRLLLNPQYSQLCGPERPIQMSSLKHFCGRLLDNPDVAAEAPHLREYICDILPPWGITTPTRWAEPPATFFSEARGKSVGWAMQQFGVDYRIIRRWFDEAGIVPTHGLAIPVPKPFHSFAAKETNLELARRFDVSVATVAGWRAKTGIRCTAPRKYHAEAGAIVYPFVIHDGGKPEHALLRKVNAAVPKSFDPETRADICQDLVVGILCGDFDEDDLNLPAKEMTRRVMKMFPTKYGPSSIDEIIPGTDSLRLIDTLTEEDGLWARI